MIWFVPATSPSYCSVHYYTSIPYAATAVLLTRLRCAPPHAHLHHATRLHASLRLPSLSLTTLAADSWRAFARVLRDTLAALLRVLPMLFCTPQCLLRRVLCTVAVLRQNLALVQPLTRATATRGRIVDAALPTPAAPPLPTQHQRHGSHTVAAYNLMTRLATLVGTHCMANAPDS